jgi:uncharacterized membrane protein YphA (DoxX/SURF4 family)
MSELSRFARLQPWLSLVVRLSMAGILVASSVPKLMDLPQSVVAVRAYRLLPEAIVPLVGHLLPVVELILAAVLLAGVFTRAAGVVWLLMMAGFLTGVIWAWSQGLQIDCGCFGGGGDLAEGETTNYSTYVAERLGFVALGAYLVAFPRTRFSLDAWMAGTDRNEVNSTESA